MFTKNSIERELATGVGCSDAPPELAAPAEAFRQGQRSTLSLAADRFPIA